MTDLFCVYKVKERNYKIFCLRLSEDDVDFDFVCEKIHKHEIEQGKNYGEYDADMWRFKKGVDPIKDFKDKKDIELSYDGRTYMIKFNIEIPKQPFPCWQEGLKRD